jgi:hypothetical protein
MPATQSCNRPCFGVRWCFPCHRLPETRPRPPSRFRECKCKMASSTSPRFETCWPAPTSTPGPVPSSKPPFPCPLACGPHAPPARSGEHQHRDLDPAWGGAGATAGQGHGGRVAVAPGPLQRRASQGHRPVGAGVACGSGHHGLHAYRDGPGDEVRMLTAYRLWRPLACGGGVEENSDVPPKWCWW